MWRQRGNRGIFTGLARVQLTLTKLLLAQSLNMPSDLQGSGINLSFVPRQECVAGVGTPLPHLSGSPTHLLCYQYQVPEVPATVTLTHFRMPHLMPDTSCVLF